VVVAAILGTRHSPIIRSLPEIEKWASTFPKSLPTRHVKTVERITLHRADLGFPKGERFGMIPAFWCYNPPPGGFAQ